MISALLCLAIVTGASGRHAAVAQEARRSPGVARVAYVLEVDAARVRAVAWTAADANDAQAVEAAAAVVRRRLDAMERAVVVTTDPEARRIEVAMPQVQPRDRELFEEMLEGLGLCEFLVVADVTGVPGLALEVALEQGKLEAWRETNSPAPLAAFNALAAADGGPDARLAWVETLFGTELGKPLPLLLPASPEDHVGALSFERVFATVDAFGYPALGFELTASRAQDFERFTEAHVDQRLAIVVEGRVRSAPLLHTKLVNGGIIEGRFNAEDVERLVSGLRKPVGPLRVVEVR